MSYFLATLAPPQAYPTRHSDQPRAEQNQSAWLRHSPRTGLNPRAGRVNDGGTRVPRLIVDATFRVPDDEGYILDRERRIIHREDLVKTTVGCEDGSDGPLCEVALRVRTHKLRSECVESIPRLGI